MIQATDCKMIGKYIIELDRFINRGKTWTNVRIIIDGIKHSTGDPFPCKNPPLYQLFWVLKCTLENVGVIDNDIINETNRLIENERIKKAKKSGIATFSF